MTSSSRAQRVASPVTLTTKFDAALGYFGAFLALLLFVVLIAVTLQTKAPAGDEDGVITLYGP